MIRTIRYQYLTVIWGIFTLVMCNLRIDTKITGSGLFFEGFDKLAHTGFFFVLTILLFSGRIKQKSTYSYSISTIVTVFAICLFFGGAIEFIQEYFSTYRSAEWWDLCCDMLGCCMGIFSYIFLHRMNAGNHAVPAEPRHGVRKTLQISLPLNDDE